MCLTGAFKRPIFMPMNNALAPQTTTVKRAKRSQDNGKTYDSFTLMGGASDYDTINGVPCVEVQLDSGHRVWFKEADTLNDEGSVYVQEYAQRIR